MDELNGIVSGLFGLTPQQAWQQHYEQQNAIAQQAFNNASGTPGQLRAQASSSVGSGLVDMVAGMMGVEPVSVVKARKEQTYLQGVNLEDPASIRARANQITDPQYKLKLGILANAVESRLAELELKKAHALYYKGLGKQSSSNNTDTVTRSIFLDQERFRLNLLGKLVDSNVNFDDAMKLADAYAPTVYNNWLKISSAEDERRGVTGQAKTKIPEYQVDEATKEILKKYPNLKFGGSVKAPTPTPTPAPAPAPAPVTVKGDEYTPGQHLRAYLEDSKNKVTRNAEQPIITQTPVNVDEQGFVPWSSNVNKQEAVISEYPQSSPVETSALEPSAITPPTVIAPPVQNQVAQLQVQPQVPVQPQVQMPAPAPVQPKAIAATQSVNNADLPKLPHVTKATVARQIEYAKEAAKKDPDLEAKYKTAGQAAELSTKEVHELYVKAEQAKTSLRKAQELKNHLEKSDAITGLGAEQLKTLAKIRAFFGSKYDSEKVSNTEIASAMLGSGMYSEMKALGITSTMMNTEREAEIVREVLFGQIPMNKQTLLKLADIRMEDAQNTIDRYYAAVETAGGERYLRASGKPKPNKPTVKGEPVKVNSISEANKLPVGTEFILNGRRGRIK